MKHRLITRIRSLFINVASYNRNQCSINVPSMFHQCSINVPSMLHQCSINVANFLTIPLVCSLLKCWWDLDISPLETPKDGRVKLRLPCPWFAVLSLSKSKNRRSIGGSISCLETLEVEALVCTVGDFVGGGTVWFMLGESSRNDLNSD